MFGESFLLPACLFVFGLPVDGNLLRLGRGDASSRPHCKQHASAESENQKQNIRRARFQRIFKEARIHRKMQNKRDRGDNADPHMAGFPRFFPERQYRLRARALHERKLQQNPRSRQKAERKLQHYIVYNSRSFHNYNKSGFRAKVAKSALFVNSLIFRVKRQSPIF